MSPYLNVPLVAPGEHHCIIRSDGFTIEAETAAVTAMTAATITEDIWQPTRPSRFFRVLQTSWCVGGLLAFVVVVVVGVRREKARSFLLRVLYE